MERIEPIRIVLDEYERCEYHQISETVAVEFQVYREKLEIKGADGRTYYAAGEWHIKKTAPRYVKMMTLIEENPGQWIPDEEAIDPTMSPNQARALAADLTRAAAYLEQWEAEHGHS